MVHGTIYYKYRIAALMIVCYWEGTFPTRKCWVLCTVRILVPCNSKHKHDKGYTEEYVQDSFLTMPFVHTTPFGNRIYQICCIMNHFQENDRSVLFFTFYKNRKWFHSGRKLRKLGKSQKRDESVLYLAHAQPNHSKNCR